MWLARNMARSDQQVTARIDEKGWRYFRYPPGCAYACGPDHELLGSDLAATLLSATAEIGTAELCLTEAETFPTHAAGEPNRVRNLRRSKPPGPKPARMIGRIKRKREIRFG